MGTTQNFEQILQTPIRGAFSKAFKAWVDAEIRNRSLSVDLPLCEKMFLLRHKLSAIPSCENCGKPVKFQKSVTKYMRFCSQKCSATSTSTQETKRRTNKKKYGVINAANRDKESRSKRLFAERFVEFKQFADKVVPLFSEEDWHGGISKSKYPWKCVRCNTEFVSALDSTFPPCSKCEGSYSDMELIVKKFLDEHNIVYQPHNRRIIGDHRMEIDFYVPSLRVGIEVHGLWYHSEKHFPRMYHQTKAKVCQDKDIRLIQIFSDELLHKPAIVKSKLSSILHIKRNMQTIGARKCEVRTVDKKKALAFLKENHIQGADRAQLHYGAFYGDVLVGVMSFCRPRVVLGYKKDSSFWELSRFCTLSGYQLAGLFSKMIKHFKNENPEIKRLISYADNRWTCPSNNVYTKSGFVYVSTSRPSYFYCKKGEGKNLKRLHRFGFRKDILVRKYPEKAHMTETEIMEELGYWRVWDAGQHKFELVL